VQPDKNCKIELTGTANPEFLKSPLAVGQLVHFTADIDRKTNKAISPVNELEFVSQAAILAEKDRGGLNGGAANGKKGTAATSTGPISVFGKIKEFKNNQLLVESPAGPVTVDVGSNPTIKIDVNDVRFAQAGDKVEASGYVVKPGEAVVQQMRITLANPLGGDGAKKKTTRPTATKK
jgi:hypothetical protein